LELTRIYSAVVTLLQGNLTGITAASLQALLRDGSPRVAGAVRMALALAIFHHTWLLNPQRANAAATAAALRAHLSPLLLNAGPLALHADHRLVFEFLLRGPLPARPDGLCHNAPLSIFTAEALADVQGDARVTASFLVGIMAVLVGVNPAGDAGASGVIFSDTPFRLARHLLLTFGKWGVMPGSHWTGKAFMDCAFKDDPATQMLLIDPTIMGGRMAFRYALNSFVWAGPLLGAILHFDSANPTNCDWLVAQGSLKPENHFQNYAREVRCCGSCQCLLDFFPPANSFSIYKN
jgi:hypothetical protein